MVWHGMEYDFSVFHTDNFLPYHFHKILKIFHSILKFSSVFHSILQYLSVVSLDHKLRVICIVLCNVKRTFASSRSRRYKQYDMINLFNRFACFWPKGYQLRSLGKSHQNGNYLKQAMRKIVFPQESNLQPLDYLSTALPLELEKTPPRMLNA